MPSHESLMALAEGIAVVALGLLFGAALAGGAKAREVHCQRTATGETVCDDGVRITPTATGTRIERPGERPLRCARTVVGVACRD